MINLKDQDGYIVFHEATVSAIEYSRGYKATFRTRNQVFEIIYESSYFCCLDCVCYFDWLTSFKLLMYSQKLNFKAMAHELNIAIRGHIPASIWIGTEGGTSLLLFSCPAHTIFVLGVVGKGSPSQ